MHNSISAHSGRREPMSAAHNVDVCAMTAHTRLPRLGRAGLPLRAALGAGSLFGPV
jgi:hypothetical protein